MTAQAISVIVNAGSGRGNDDALARPAAQQVRGRRLRCRGRRSRDGGDEISAAVGKRRSRGGADVIVAGGGDGTVSAVAARAASAPASPLGVLPLGTLNHFAKDLGIPLDLDEAVARRSPRASARRSTSARSTAASSSTTPSLGLYPDIVRDRERQQQRLRPRQVAGAGAGRRWRALRRYPVPARAPARRRRASALRRTPFVFIGNNEYRMEGFDDRRARAPGRRPAAASTSRSGRGRCGLLRLALRALLGRLRQARDFDAIARRASSRSTSRQRAPARRHRRRGRADDDAAALPDPPGARCAVLAADAGAA